MAKNSLRAAGLGGPQQPFSAALVAKFHLSDTYIEGALALEQGFVLSAMIWAAITVYIIEQRFGQAAIWSLVAAALAWVGLLHSYQWTVADTVVRLGWGVAAPWAVSYLLLAVLLLYAAWQYRPQKIS
jgi:AGZA family xanthine/uracil permease-like MFS transporter